MGKTERKGGTRGRKTQKKGGIRKRKTQNKGGAMGRYSGPGYVYTVKKGPSKYKTGCSKDPNRRLKELQRKDPKAELLKIYKANEMNGAESAAQKSNIRMGSRRAKKVATDWLIKPKGKSWEDVTRTTRNAVYRHNHLMKKGRR